MKRRWLLIISLPLIFLGLLALDLAFKGLAWQFFWSQTGEERPIGQIRGMVEVTGNLLRAQPNTQPLTPINHTDAPPYGINVFLQKEVEEPKIRAMLEMIQEAGFVWLRQEFPWEDLEVDGRGQFTDTRNDFNGDGELDTIDAWLKYDRIVDLVEEYDLRLMVRLSNPPKWSRAENPDTAGGAVAPPDDFQDFVNYAVAVAERYQGRITHYQIWNEPNIYPEWGEQFADPVAYTELLCRTHDALKEVDPDIVVISGAIAPTISLDGFFGYQDVLYLQNMYGAGAGDCFDVLSAQGYGLFSGPTDRRTRLTTVNYARHTLYRDLMVANGDEHKPIWISEAAWNAVGDAELPPEQISDYDRFGVNTRDEAARWMPIAYERAQQEWAWIGQVSYWFFTRPDPSEVAQSFFHFRMVEPDYSPETSTFTPLPVYDSMKAYITEQVANPVLYHGVHQAESWEITHNGSLVDDSSAQFEQTIEATNLSFTAYASQIRLRVKSEVPIQVSFGESTQTIDVSDDWKSVVLLSNTLAQSHDITLTSDALFMLDSVIVADHTWRNIMPLLLIGGLLALFFSVELFVAIRQRMTT